MPEIELVKLSCTGLRNFVKYFILAAICVLKVKIISLTVI